MRQIMVTVHVKDLIYEADAACTTAWFNFNPRYINGLNRRPEFYEIHFCLWKGYMMFASLNHWQFQLLKL